MNRRLSGWSTSDTADARQSLGPRWRVQSLTLFPCPDSAAVGFLLYNLGRRCSSYKSTNLGWTEESATGETHGVPRVLKTRADVELIDPAQSGLNPRWTCRSYHPSSSTDLRRALPVR